MKKLLLLFISVLCLGLASYAEEQLTINFNSTDLGNNATVYVRTAFNFTKGGITFTINNVNPSSGQIQCNKTPTETTAFYIYNTTPLDNIKMIEVYFTSSDKTKTPNKLYFNVGDTEISSAITSGNDGSWNSKELIATWTSEAGKSYFRINANKNVGGTVKVEKLVITYGSESTTAPEIPVVKFGNTVCENNGTYLVNEGAEVTVSSTGATKIYVNDIEQIGNSCMFNVTQSGEYKFKGSNDYGFSEEVTITFNIAAPETPTVSSGETVFENGGTYNIEKESSVTVSSKGATSIYVNDTEFNTGDSYTFTIYESGTYSFFGANSTDLSDEMIVTFNVVKPVGSGIVYSLVTSGSDLVAGETYTIGCASKGTVMSNATSNDYRQYVEDVDFTTGSFEIKSNMLALTLEQDGNGWKIKTQNYTGTNGYFNAVDASEKNNNLLIDETGAKWAIEIGEDESHNATISTPDFTNTRYIYWNPSSPRFSAYLKPQTEVQLYRETVVAPTLEVDGEVINTTGNVDVKAGSVIRIIGHEANELHYIHTSTTTANRAPAANTEGWTKHDSNIYEYTVEPDFATKHITITAKGVNGGKESAPVSITLHNGSTTGIEGVESAENDAEVEWFTITGVRVQQPAEGGLYIRRQGSEVSKVRF